MGSEKVSRKYQANTGDIKQDGKSKQGKRKSKNPTLTIYWLLACFRTVLTLIPQTGYIHPDEYFQTVEVVAGDVFDLEVERPWEFNVTFPIRSILLPKILYGIPYIFLSTITPDLSDFLGWDIRTPYVMLVLPRLVACALSFVTDYCLYKICISYGQKYRSRLLILATSYVPVVFGTRTLSNSLEMAFMSLLLYLVADCMVISDKVIYQEEFLDRKYSSASTPVERTKLYKMRAALPPHSLRRCFTIASIVVAGIFNRPTFFAFGLAPVFFWLQRGISSKYCGIRAFHTRIFTFTLCAIPALLIFILADSFYYGHLTWDEIGMGDVSLNSFVVTPFNFLLYNSRESNLAQHGLHPRVTHMFLNIPLLYNVLGFTGIVAVSNFCVRASQARWRELPRAQSLMMLMTASLLIPVILLSLVPHQEARFLIPITLPLVFLHAQEIQDMDTKPALMFNKQQSVQDKQKSSLNSKTTAKTTKKRGKSLINLWIVINCSLAVFFGFIHQGGIYPLTAHIKGILARQTKPQVMHLVTNYMYPIPQSLLVQRNSQHMYFDSVTKIKYLVTRRFYAHELGSISLPEVCDVIKKVIYEAELIKKKENLDYAVYLAIPSSVVEDISIIQGSNLTFVKESVFYPHISTEALPKVFHLPYNLTFLGSGEDDQQGKCTERNSNRFEDGGKSCKETVQGTDESLTDQFLKLLRQFSLSLYRVQI